MRDQAQNLREMVQRENAARATQSFKMTKVRSLAVVSGKGGVGKSNVSVFLAKALAMRNKKVLIFDGDLGLANLHILLGISPKGTLANYLKNACAVEDIIHRVQENVDLIPGGSGDVSPNSDMTRAICDLINISQDYDYLLIDGGAGISENTIRLAVCSNQILLIMTPDPTSLADAYATLKVLVSRGQKNVSLLVNMAQSAAEAEAVKNKLCMMSQKFTEYTPEFLGILPKSEKLASLIREDIGVLSKSVGDFSLKINTLAAKIDGEVSANDDLPPNFFVKFIQNLGGKL